MKSVSTGFCTDTQLLFSFVSAFVVTATSLTQLLVSCMHVRGPGQRRQLKGEVGHGPTSACDKGLGLSAVKVGTAALTLSRDCRPSPPRAWPPLLQWLRVPAPACPSELLGLGSWPGLLWGDRPQFLCKTGLYILLCSGLGTGPVWVFVAVPCGCVGTSYATCDHDCGT